MYLLCFLVGSLVRCLYSSRHASRDAQLSCADPNNWALNRLSDWFIELYGSKIVNCDWSEQFVLFLFTAHKLMLLSCKKEIYLYLLALQRA